MVTDVSPWILNRENKAGSGRGMLTTVHTTQLNNFPKTTIRQDEGKFKALLVQPTAKQKNLKNTLLKMFQLEPLSEKIKG